MVRLGCSTSPRRLGSEQRKSTGDFTCTNHSICQAKLHSSRAAMAVLVLGMADAMAQAGADIVIWGTNAEKNEAGDR